CIYHPTERFFHPHMIQCLYIRQRLLLPTSIEESLSFLLSVLSLYQSQFIL
ncbi:MAG: hypothetical protein EXX96DRAFT_488123, partial [Benjaminiella poitrasii]